MTDPRPDGWMDELDSLYRDAQGTKGPLNVPIALQKRLQRECEKRWGCNSVSLTAIRLYLQIPLQIGPGKSYTQRFLAGFGLPYKHYLRMEKPERKSKRGSYAKSLPQRVWLLNTVPLYEWRTGDGGKKATVLDYMDAGDYSAFRRSLGADPPEFSWSQIAELWRRCFPDHDLTAREDLPGELKKMWQRARGTYEAATDTDHNRLPLWQGLNDLVAAYELLRDKASWTEGESASLRDSVRYAFRVDPDQVTGCDPVLVTEYKQLQDKPGVTRDELDALLAQVLEPDRPLGLRPDVRSEAMRETLRFIFDIAPDLVTGCDDALVTEYKALRRKHSHTGAESARMREIVHLIFHGSAAGRLGLRSDARAAAKRLQIRLRAAGWESQDPLLREHTARFLAVARPVLEAGEVSEAESAYYSGQEAT